MTAKKVLIISGVVVIVALVGGTGFMLFRGFREFSKEEAKLRTSVEALKGYYDRNPFPSEANADADRKDVDLIDARLGDLAHRLRQDQVDAGQKTPSTFMAFFGDQKNELDRLARAQGVGLPPDFAFGFDAYYRSGALPAPADVPRLTLQVLMIEDICRVLFAARVNQVLSIDRDVFEDMTQTEAGEGSEGGRFRRGGGGVGSATPSTVRHAGSLGEGDLYAKLHFAISFKARERNVISILNHLAADRMFMVVTSLTFQKNADDVIMPKELGEATNGPSAMAFSAATNAASAFPERRERLVCGPSLEEPMTVNLDMDVYRFR